MSKRRCVPALMLGVLLLATLSPLVSGYLPRERGRNLVERECARCHAVSRTDESPHRMAPPFRDLPKKYAIENLAEALAEGIVVGHKDMPEFAFEPDDIEAILIFISDLAQ